MHIVQCPQYSLSNGSWFVYILPTLSRRTEHHFQHFINVKKTGITITFMLNAGFLPIQLNYMFVYTNTQVFEGAGKSHLYIIMIFLKFKSRCTFNLH